MEILSLAGTVAFDGARSSSHLHMALSTGTGQVLGGHVAAGCTVRTTAEVLLALLPGWAFTREPDAATGFEELVVRAVTADDGSVRPGDEARLRLAARGIDAGDMADAVAWARKPLK
jgi:hypothetical protein